MSGQRPDDEDDEQEEEEEEQQNPFLQNAQHIVFDDDQVENESAEEDPMLAPSSLPPSSEDGSQFADDDCEDTATAHDAHDEVCMVSRPHAHALVLVPFALAHITPIHSSQM